MRETMKATTAKLLGADLETFDKDIDDLFRQHIINPFLRIVKWTAVAFVVVNLLMLIFGDTRFIEDFSVMDRLYWEWKELQWWIEREILRTY